MKRLIMAVMLAAALMLSRPAAAQTAYYTGYYYTSWLWPVFGYQCYWQYAVWADGSGFYFDTCGGSVGWF